MFVFVLNASGYVVQAGLKLEILSQFLWSVVVTGVCHHTWLSFPSFLSGFKIFKVLSYVAKDDPDLTMQCRLALN